MKTQLYKSRYDLIALLGLLVWFVGSWYFGWNAVAETNGEEYTDTIGAILMIYGFLNSFVRGLKTKIYIQGGTISPREE